MEGNIHVAEISRLERMVKWPHLNKPSEAAGCDECSKNRKKRILFREEFTPNVWLLAVVQGGLRFERGPCPYGKSELHK